MLFFYSGIIKNLSEIDLAEVSGRTPWDVCEVKKSSKTLLKNRLLLINDFR
jgi:hypothetical protein